MAKSGSYCICTSKTGNTAAFCAVPPAFISLKKKHTLNLQLPCHCPQVQAETRFECSFKNKTIIFSFLLRSAFTLVKDNLKGDRQGKKLKLIQMKPNMSNLADTGALRPFKVVLYIDLTEKFKKIIRAEQKRMVTDYVYFFPLII